MRERVSEILGRTLPAAEVLAAGALVVFPAVGGVAAAFLFLMFAFAVGMNLRRGRTELVCGCFGAGGRHVISWWHVGSNAVLATMATGAAVVGARPKTPAVVLGITLLLTAMVAWSVTQAVFPNQLARTKEV